MFVNSSATDIVLVTLSSTAVERAIAQCTSRWAMARGHRLNTSIVLAAVHGLFGRFPRSSLSLSRPLPTLSLSLIGHLASVDVKQHESKHYLSELLLVYTPSCTLRSSSDTRMLKIQQYKCKSHGFRAFSCFEPHIWNSLPQDLRHCSTLSSFKANLKTFLSSQYFHTI